MFRLLVRRVFFFVSLVAGGVVAEMDPYPDTGPSS